MSSGNLGESRANLGDGRAACSVQWEERNEHDPLVGAVVEDVVPAAVKEVVLVLNRGLLEAVQWPSEQTRRRSARTSVQAPT